MSKIWKSERTIELQLHLKFKFEHAIESQRDYCF